ncbi:MAG: hypothetical protein ACRCX2_02995 [Paraclostridium sp.]
MRNILALNLHKSLSVGLIDAIISQRQSFTHLVLYNISEENLSSCIRLVDTLKDKHISTVANNLDIIEYLSLVARYTIHNTFIYTDTIPFIKNPLATLIFNISDPEKVTMDTINKIQKCDFKNVFIKANSDDDIGLDNIKSLFTNIQTTLGVSMNDSLDNGLIDLPQIECVYNNTVYLNERGDFVTCKKAFDLDIEGPVLGSIDTLSITDAFILYADYIDKDGVCKNRTCGKPVIKLLTKRKSDMVRYERVKITHSC